MASYGLLAEVRSCCGCISLQHGAYIIAAIYFVLGVCGFGLSVHQQDVICSVFQAYHVQSSCADPFFVSIIIASILEVVVCVLLAVGVKIKNRYILVPWMIWNAVLIPLSIAFSIYVAAVAFSIRLTGPASPPGFTAVLISMMTAVPTLYGVVVVYSLFRLQNDADIEGMKPLDEENANTKL